MDEHFWTRYYTHQAQQSGHGSAFAGVPYQRGGGLGSIFKGLFRAILPVAKSMGKAVGRQALRTGAGIMSDIASGQNVKQSIKRRGRQGAKKLAKKAIRRVNQRGGYLGKRKSSRMAKSIKGPRKRKATIKRSTKNRDIFGQTL